MTTTLTPARPSLRGPARVVVRQHRLTLWIVGGLALAAVVGLIALVLRSSHVAEVFGASNCPVDGGAGRACDQTARTYADSMNTYRRVFDYYAALLVALPTLFSAFVAGPVIARELESGTYRMSWTQSVSPARWLAARLAVPAVLLVAGTAALAVCLHGARALADLPYRSEWYSAQVYATTGTVLAAHVLFALCVGAVAGLLIRRVLPALTVSVLATGAVTAAFTYFRGLLWPRATVTGRSLDVESDIWWVETGHITGAGERLPQDVCAQVSSATDYARCMADHDVTSHYLDYHPASHFWPLQLVETGILLALAAVALAVAFRVLRRLHG
ncbi:hypothetical protein [Streptomyces sp. NBC_01185]|uniref:hypothetical protein n=1 Tax=Streptomyces sp. NBC_01185 TaxID=2903764 RepID=UPI003867323B|nr:hypothetical protein OG770_17095 [Streptomyces sp. NBC_01185]